MTPKQRMLAAYRGDAVDTPPVAPEFWYYYPARILGVDMIELQREIPFWQALQTTFTRFSTEGWGVAFVGGRNPDATTEAQLTAKSDDRFLERRTTRFRGHTFTSAAMYHRVEPSWSVEHPVKDDEDLRAYLNMRLSPDLTYDFAEALSALQSVGEDYLLEMWLGAPFFDLFEGCMGFEAAALLFCSSTEEWLEDMRERYVQQQLRFLRLACKETPFESFAIGCSSSCTSLLGTALWRQWDRPYIARMCREAHRHGRLVHLHFHGRSMEAASDFPEMGVDCVCPFERPPGGDVEGLEGLRQIRQGLNDRVTMNGNVHTVETLIRGGPEDVRREVREIKQAFAGTSRFIIGTGDQVGRETPEENIHAMVEEARAR